MRPQKKGWLCAYCSTSTRIRCESHRNGNPDIILGICREAETLGARYDLYASGKCVFRYTGKLGGMVAHG
jgi:biotin synthase-like enzyme